MKKAKAVKVDWQAKYVELANTVEAALVAIKREENKMLDSRQVYVAQMSPPYTEHDAEMLAHGGGRMLHIVLKSLTHHFLAHLPKEAADRLTTQLAESASRMALDRLLRGLGGVTPQKAEGT